MFRPMIARAPALLAACAAASIATQQLAVAQENDSTYASKIREYTTDDRFLSDLVDHLPTSATVPSPLDYFGTIIGAPNILHNTTEIYGYMRAVADASPRVSIRTIGYTEENREMIEVIIADEETMADLERYRGMLNSLADPRAIDEGDARSMIADAKPIYYFTAGLHSPETGPPEMVMELAYRLAVEETPLIQAIRDNVIVVIVPATEPDGRDRMVDVYNYRKAHRDVGPGLRYWGKYVAHDNNRDGYGFGLALTRNIFGAYMHWKPTVMHDLHESGYFLYTSTGTGPYNDAIDALTIDEWHNLAHEEVTELTKRGMPGVWTHAFYTGWAANYLIWMANTRNSIGRFYETLGNGGADTRERVLPDRVTSRQWYRPNPPLKKVIWSLRNNTNYMQSGVLAALKYVADNKQEFVENFYSRSKRSVERGVEEAPHAWVIPRDQRRPLAAVALANLLMQQGIEVHVAEENLQLAASESDSGDAETLEVPKGSFVVRMDQPYRALVQILLDKQEFPKDATPPYDDTGWTLPYLHSVDAYTIDDPSVLSSDMRRLTAPMVVEGGLNRRGRPYYLLNNTTDDNVSAFRFRLADIAMDASETAFEADDHEFAAGSFIIATEGQPADVEDRLDTVARELGLELIGVRNRPQASTHEVEVPRMALVHTWVSTPQDAGWWRLAFDRIGIPFTYLSEQDLATNDLTGFDVVIMPRSRSNPQQLVGGTTGAGDPIPWQQTDEHSAIGIVDQTDDMRKGMGYDGLKNLKAFVERGGVFITEGSTVSLPIDMAITRRVSIRSTKQLVARGTVLKTTVADEASPIVYGYADSLAAYFNQSPVLRVDTSLGGTATPDWFKDEVWQKEMPRTVMNFSKKDVLMSGMLRGESEIAGTPAVVDVPVGQGHVVLFAIRPFWRLQTYGSHALVFNTMLHWNDLRTGWPERPGKQPDVAAAGGRSEH